MWRGSASCSWFIVCYFGTHQARLDSLGKLFLQGINIPTLHHELRAILKLHLQGGTRWTQSHIEQPIPSPRHTRGQLPWVSLWNEHSQALGRMLSPKSAAFSAVQAPLSYPGFIQCSVDPKISVLQLAQHLTFLLIFDSYPEKSSFSLMIKAALYSGQYGNKNFFHLKQSIFTGHKETTPATKVHLYFNQQK